MKKEVGECHHVATMKLGTSGKYLARTFKCGKGGWKKKLLGFYVMIQFQNILIPTPQKIVHICNTKRHTWSGWLERKI